MNRLVFLIHQWLKKFFGLTHWFILQAISEFSLKLAEASDVNNFFRGCQLEVSMYVMEFGKIF